MKNKPENFIIIIVYIYGFTGRYLYTESGLWHFRARYYSDELGRFISRDPTGYVDGMSLYNGYFAARFGVDYSGEVWWSIVALVVVIIIKRIAPKIIPKKVPKKTPKKKGSRGKKNNTGTGNCSKGQYALLKAAVTAAYKKKFSCSRLNSSKYCPQMSINLAFTQSCAASKRAINNRCFGGGNAGHRQAAIDAQKANFTCIEKIEKYCKCPE